ncbi:MAG TPA: YihY/virulence factor BrkB family protein [Steroidobacteraceae bacterium]|jgi:membrane protein|nr:YihY/virulence factor BrkB family protein [Steroidobacteraceae bacterium]
MAPIRTYLLLFKRAGQAWIADNATSMGAALAFYSAFALAPLLLILSAIAGLVFGQAQGHAALLAQMHALIGPVGSEAVQQILAQTSKASASVAATVIGLLLLLIGASSVMVELQQDLDHIWQATMRIQGRPYWSMFRSRAAALILVLAFGFVLLLSLIVGTALNALVAHSALFAQHSLLLRSLHMLVTLLVFSLLFAMLFKWLPNVRLAWRDVWHGAFVTALLFTLGQLGIGYYLGHSTTTSAYAAAASLLVLLLWLYYAALIFLFGAEFIWTYTQEHRAAEAQRSVRAHRAAT